jgi:hypothetical protein
MVAEGFMGAAAILVVVAMDGAVAVTAGVVAVTDTVGTVLVGMGAVGMVEGMGVGGTGAVGMVVVRIGMAVLPTGGGATPIRMLTDRMVGNRWLGVVAPASPRTVGMSSCSSASVGKFGTG